MSETDDIKVKFWAGRMSPDNMSNIDWITVWRRSAKEEQDKDCELVIFRLPKDQDAIRKIEQFCQDNFTL